MTMATAKKRNDEQTDGEKGDAIVEVRDLTRSIPMEPSQSKRSVSASIVVISVC